MSPGELKPILAALVLPPASPLLLVALGAVLALRRRVRTGVAIVLLGSVALWLVSCQAVAMLLFSLLLPPVEPLKPGQLEQAQAIVVLGGGVLAQAPEYGEQQPSGVMLGRLRYAAWLAKASGKPLGFAGGVGWSSVGAGIAPEAQVAAPILEAFGVPLRWADSSSRDTAENAQEMRRLLQPAGVTRIALVTDAWHMPRSVLAFQQAGFEVTPAPTGFPTSQTRSLLAWLPSAEGLALSRQVLREALGLVAARL